ncbi:MAG: S46 family peptidase, partial [Planctomycetota bacterium]
PLRSLSISLLAIVGLSAFAFHALHADEGEWLPEQLKDLAFGAFKARGLELSADEIWNGEEGLLSAAVQINGCSSSFVSNTGLIVTNHHCGFDAINDVSTLEKNYLRDGFIAADVGEEIPAPGYSVSFVRRYEDVTVQIEEAADAAGLDPAERWQAVQAERRRLEQEAAGPDSSAIVVPYFEGRSWRRIWRTVLPDVRLVYAPPRAVGEYGGETDNWMWPRHTGDFSFFRAYVGPDGNPAAYSEENVPYQPPRHLEVSNEGVEDGDFVMIMGYPGRTNRYLSSIAVAARESYYYPSRYRVFDAVIKAYEEVGKRSPELELQVQSPIKRFSNGLKNADGMVWGLARNGVVERKNQEENAFRQWVGMDSARERRYGQVLDQLLALDLEEYERQQHDFVLTQMRYRSSALRGMVESLMRGEEISFTSLEDRLGEFALVDERALAVLFAMADALPKEERLGSYDAWRAAGGDMGSLDELARLMMEDLDEQQDFLDEVAGRRMKVGALWIAAQEEWRGKTFYPDANSTLRVSTATVKGYAPRDGVWHVPHTTVDGMIAKDEGGGDFEVPREILAAVHDAPVNGGISVCFLADGDTTGGNSGSPVVDGKGRLVGLNFDRVFENVSGDFGWNAERSRNISVDMQYVLWLMRDIWPAPRLLVEMEVE